jgi:hypothetical protein
MFPFLDILVFHSSSKFMMFNVLQPS